MEAMFESTTSGKKATLSSAKISVKSSLSFFAQKYLRKSEDTWFIIQNKYLCIYEDSFGAKIVREDCAPKSSISIGINIHKLLLVIAIWTSKSREPGVLCLIIIFIPGIYSQVIAEWLGSILKRAAFLLSRIYYRRRQFLVVGSTRSWHTE